MGKFIHSATSLAAMTAMMLGAANASPGSVYFSANAGSSIGEETKTNESKSRAFLSFLLDASARTTNARAAASTEHGTCPEEDEKKMAKVDDEDAEEEPSLSGPEPVYFAF
ncbi:hypothetical protein [Hyphococcus lacteus]|uniref:Uncharacterized protein n=1 Tax=Hyphococcus lacteus TaxID=3143536 RepID=A0ABV3Z8Y0_9PROT